VSLQFSLFVASKRGEQLSAHQMTPFQKQRSCRTLGIAR
jgi:hypothetical protein